MNILYVIHENRKNGAFKSLLDFILPLSKDHNVIVLAKSKKGAAIEELEKNGIRVISIPFWECRIVNRNPNCIYRAIKRSVYFLLNVLNCITSIVVSIKLKKQNLDIIHTNSSVILEGAFIAKILKVKHICHIREFGEEDFNLQFCIPSKWYYHFISINTECFIYISKAIQEKYSKIIKTKKEVQLYNYVNMNNLSRKNFRYNISSGNIIKFLITGSIWAAKGQEQACDAIKILMDKGYKDIELYIAGQGDIEDLYKYIKNIGIENNVKILGYVENMIRLRSLVDVELMCSKCEAFGRVTVEAMMSSNPVVGSNTGGTKELVENGYNGFLYNYGDAEDLANKMEYFCKDRLLRDSMGRNAYESVLNKYDIETYLHNLVNIYSE